MSNTTEQKNDPMEPGSSNVFEELGSDESPNISSYKAWYASILHKHIKEVTTQLQKYKTVGYWIVSMETCNRAHKDTFGQHMHFLAKMTDRDFNAFRDWLKRHFGLQPKATDDHARQFGKVKTIENLARMAMYTVKDGNVQTNMPEEQLRLLTKQSFQKVDKKDEIKMIYEHLDTKASRDMNIILFQNGLREIKMEIINYVLDKQLSPDLNSPTVDRIFRNWVKATMIYNTYDKRKIFYRVCNID